MAWPDIDDPEYHLYADWQFRVADMLDSPDELPAQGKEGVAYIIADHMWIWLDHAWRDVGHLRGPKGDKGNKGDKGDIGPSGGVWGAITGNIAEQVDLQEALSDVSPEGLASLAGGNRFSGPQRVSASTLTDGATVTPDLNLNNMFLWTMTANSTLANPANMAGAIGQELLIVCRGAFQPSFGSYYKWPNGIAPTFSGELNALGGTVISDTEILMHGAVGYA